MNNMCPVCGYSNLKTPAYTGVGGIPYSGADGRGSPSYEYCPSCDFQFGVTDYDEHISQDQWREQWIAGGMKWRSKTNPPPGWNPEQQLANINPGK